MADHSVTSADRITNRTPPRDPNDKSEANADNIMLIADNIISGSYRMKGGKVYADFNALALVTGTSGEIAYCTAEDQFYRWNRSLATWTPAF
jgi:hypothetical protein